jgi:hypothetical protein
MTQPISKGYSDFAESEFDMKPAELERRLRVLENEVQELRTLLVQSVESTLPWWRTTAGSFRDDPVFDEIVRLGKEYRQSLRPGRKNAKR